MTSTKTSAGTTFMGLQSYGVEQAGQFFGRDTEIEKLTTLIESNALTIVFGKSGTGKTSLLNAGVFPRLYNNYCLPFRIRLSFAEDSPDLVSQVKSALRHAIDEYKFKVKSYPGEETLWEYFHREPLWKSITPILVFDQFEEIFTLAGKNKNLGPDALEAFWKTLASLAENNIPESLQEHFKNVNNDVGYNYRKQKIKMVFAFREEFLPEFESVSHIIPSIKTSRFRLMPMNGHQAYEVITKTWKQNIADAEARHIVGYLTKDEDQQSFDLMQIEPSLLSQVCAYIDRRRLESGYDNVSADFLKKYPKETILRSIYDEAMLAASAKVFQEKEPIEIYNPVKLFLEEKLITTEGYRTRYAMAVADEPVAPGIAELITRYFIREDEQNIELTHDVLTPILKADREERRNRAAQVAERKRARKKVAIIIVGAVLLAAGTFAAASFKAKQIIDETEEEVKALQIQYTKDSLQQAELEKAIREKQQQLNDLRSSQQGIAQAGIATVPDSLADARVTDLLEDIEELRKRYKSLAAENNERKQLIETEIRRPRRMMAANPANYYNAIAEAEAENDRLRSLLRQESRRYDSLLKLYQAANALLDKLTTVDVTNNWKPVDTTNALQLDLFFSKEQFGESKPSENTPVYLIPYTAANRRIIRKAKLYEISCNEQALSTAAGVKTSRYHNGNFVFEDVAAGKYLVKICGYYGGYYTVEKTTTGSITKTLDASPPIR